MIIIIIIIIISNNNSCHLFTFEIKTVDYFAGKVVSHKKDELNHILDQFNIQVWSLRSLAVPSNNILRFISLKVSWWWQHFP